MHHIRKPLAFIIPLVDLWRPSIFKPSVEGLRPSVRHSRHGSIEVVPRRPQSQWRRCQFPRWTFARHCHHRRRPLWRQEQIPGKSQVCGEMPRSAKTQLQGWPKKDKEKKLNLKKRCTFRGVSKIFFFCYYYWDSTRVHFSFEKKRYSPPNFLLGCVSSFFSPPLALHFLNVLEKEKAKLPENKCWFFRIFNASPFPLLRSSNCSSFVLEGVPLWF